MLFRKNGPSIFAVTFAHRDNKNELVNVKTQINATKRRMVDQWVVGCARGFGYTAIKPTRLMFPRIKKGVYTWVYCIIPETWEHTLQDLRNLEQSTTHWLADFRDEEYPQCTVPLYDPQPLNDLLVTSEDRGKRKRPEHQKHQYPTRNATKKNKGIVLFPVLFRVENAKKVHCDRNCACLQVSKRKVRTIQMDNNSDKKFDHCKRCFK